MGRVFIPDFARSLVGLGCRTPPTRDRVGATEMLAG
jgi:hypothetical protein